MRESESLEGGSTQGIRALDCAQERLASLTVQLVAIVREDVTVQLKEIQKVSVPTEPRKEVWRVLATQKSDLVSIECIWHCHDPGVYSIKGSFVSQTC